MAKIAMMIVALCLCGLVAAEDMKTKIKEWRELCIEESGADRALIDKMKQTNQYIEDRKVDCYTACFLKKMGILNKEGKYDADTARQRLLAIKVDETSANELIEACKDKKGSDDCTTGAELSKCYWANKKFSVQF